jgi:serine protease inhibitor
MNKYILIFATGLCIAGCSTATQNDPIIPVPVDARAIQLSVGQQKRVGQDNDFAFDLLKKTIASSDERNVFVSPLSVSVALGMAWNGADGQTKAEMETAMKLNGLSAQTINDYYKIMQSTLPGIDATTKLSIANSMWYRTGFQVEADFLKVNTDYFNAYVKELDFSQVWAKDTINNWCSKHTNRLIPTILDEVPKEAVMYLTNAVYFKGIWRNKFDKKLTMESTFINELNNQLKVNMMCQKGAFGYAVDDKAQYLDLPYGNKAFSMTVVLPADNMTPADILNGLTSLSWNSTLNSLVERPIMVYLPRFKVESEFMLKQPLMAMGMVQAFNDAADFSNISNARLSISDVVHKTYITVDEDGTEAAAITNIGIVTTSMPDYPIFYVNKPFLFVIREKSTGVILFIGKMGAVEKF